MALEGANLLWYDIYLLENAHTGEFSYPAIQIHDGIIDILYTDERKDIKHVRFNQAWLSHQTVQGQVK